MIDRADAERTKSVLTSRFGLNGDDIALLERFVDILLTENGRQNLIAKGTIPIVWSRHILDSAQLLAYVPRETGERAWLDLGTGPGFPGLVCAMCRPDITFHLVEQRRIRFEWLETVVQALDLTNVQIHGCKVSQVTPFNADVISARAFAPLDVLLKQSAAFSTKRTLWLLPKGRSAQQELDQLDSRHHMFHVEQSITDPDSGLIVGSWSGKS